ncbi:MAG TPA: carotenoid biosynthesis protein [Polyangiaceae bacterium]|nr:carotenoid biosynthesis protein [Polyangiaceae bacterium]
MPSSSTLGLLWGSVVHRPYVYAFLACFIAFAVHHLGFRRMLLFLVPTYFVAYACEYSSTRNGFPFGPYRYFDDTRGRELWISNIPFFDSLSFVFLSYFSFVIAAALLGDVSRPVSRAIPWLGGVLMMLLDVVIDPVALQGDKWFLGRIYDYPYRGFYFGVTAANFAGWFFVGLVTQALFRFLLGAFAWSRAPLRPVGRFFVLGSYGVYAGIFLFNLTMTVIIGDGQLALASGIVTAGTLAAIAAHLARSPSRSRIAREARISREDREREGGEALK